MRKIKFKKILLILTFSVLLTLFLFPTVSAKTRVFASESMIAPTSTQNLEIDDTFIMTCDSTSSGNGNSPTITHYYQYSTSACGTSDSNIPSSNSVLTASNNPESAVLTASVSETITASSTGTVYISCLGTDGTTSRRSSECITVIVSSSSTTPEPPQIDSLILSTPSERNMTSEDISAQTSSSDENNDPVTNIYNWKKNGNELAELILAFDTNASSAKDYTSNSNNCVIDGAIWTSGKIGGAFSFNSEDNINCGNSSTLTSSEITIEAWVQDPPVWLNGYDCL